MPTTENMGFEDQLGKVSKLDRAKELLREYIRLACSQAVEDQDWTDLVEETSEFLRGNGR
jgi:hypothetical protein